MREFWLGSTEGAGAKLNELVTQPALNVRGMASSRTGNQASNVIPATATASIDIRLCRHGCARDYRPRGGTHSQAGILRGGHGAGRGRASRAREGGAGGGAGGDNAVRTPMDLPIAQEVIRVVESVRVRR